MIHNKTSNLILYILFSVLLTACVQEPVQNGLGGYINEEAYQEQFVNSESNELNLKEVSQMDTVQVDTSFIDFSNHMIDLLATNKLIEFSEHFHPQKGCVFVPYTFLSEDTQKLTTSSFNTYINSEEQLEWGTQDGSGDVITFTVVDYFKKYVYDFDYKNKSSDFHFNKDLAFSNTYNNISEFYPDADFMEFYYDGTKEFEGMDWKSLIFYVEKFEGSYVLVAVVHNQWTI